MPNTPKFWSQKSIYLEMLPDKWLLSDCSEDKHKKTRKNSDKKQLDFEKACFVYFIRDFFLSLAFSLSTEDIMTDTVSNTINCKWFKI